MSHAIKISALNKTFQDVKALDSIDLQVEQGELYGLIGPDGAGKTTLIRILTSLLKPDNGEISVLSLDPVKDYQAIRNKIGYMPGRFSLYQDLTIEENLSLFASIFGTTIEANYHLIEDIYNQIEPFKKRRAGQLSGGMKQKLALCCAMIHKPELLLLDEPTTGVDPVSRKEFWEMLKKLNQDGLTMLVSTPYMDEANMCETIGLIQEGKIMATDTPGQIIKRFTKPLFSIKGEQKFKIMKTLESYDNFDSVYSFGSELHYTDQQKVPDIRQLQHFLIQNGHHVQIKPIEAGIEDTFISLMKSHG